MDYEKIIINTLDSFGVSRSYTGYNYVVHGLLLILEDDERIERITKTLYLDIATHFHTNWTCVEKNIRTIVNCVWNSHNIEQAGSEVRILDKSIPVICPISNGYCAALSAFYIRLSKMVK